MAEWMPNRRASGPIRPLPEVKVRGCLPGAPASLFETIVQSPVPETGNRTAGGVVLSSSRTVFLPLGRHISRKQFDKEASRKYSCLVKYHGGKKMRTYTEEPLGRLIYYTAREVHNIAEKTLYPYDLTVEQMHLLKNMSTLEGITQKDLGGAVNKTPANLTRILDRLEAKSLILRRPDIRDRRVYLVYLTERGSVLREEVQKTFQRFSDGLLHGISDEMQRQVRICMKKMVENIKQMKLQPNGLAQ
jgi:DNA-binding MarR family transcriptional regulator